MLDPEIPPVAEGEADDGAGAALRTRVGRLAAATASRAEATPPRWTTIIETAAWVATRDREGADVPDLGLRIRRWNRSRCLRVKTRPRVSLPSWMTCSSRRKFRRRRAS